MKRSQIMAQVKSKNTKPEMAVRRLLFSLGYRYYLHRKNLPGKPDIVFSKRKKVIFVNGCFWHGHNCKRGSRAPKTNQDYWLEKIRKNVNRDKTSCQQLTENGWQSLILWECELSDKKALKERMTNFLGPSSV